MTDLLWREKDNGASQHGGRFAEHWRSESEVELWGGVDSAIAERPNEPLNDIQVIAVAQELARRRGFALDAEDIAQDSIVTLLGGDGASGLRHPITPTALASAVPARTASPALLPAPPLDPRLLGRTLGQPLAPAPAPLLPLPDLNLSHPIVAARMESTPAVVLMQGARAGDFANTDLLQRFEDGEVSQQQAAARAWSVIAAEEGLPPAVPTRTPVQLRDAAKVLSRSGGAAGASSSFLSGDVSPEVAAALFTPWSGLTKDEKSDITRALVARSYAADPLWLAAGQSEAWWAYWARERLAPAESLQRPRFRRGFDPVWPMSGSMFHPDFRW